MSPATEHRRILVVDDEPQITRVLRTSLSSQRYDVRVANDGDAALDIVKDWPPDLVITDLSMPQMDGLELCRHLRERLQVPIIVLSVRGQERVKVQALDVGADDYVTKPFSMDELLARVRANLRRASTSEVVEDVIVAGALHIDISAHTVQFRGNELRLTPKEFDVLAHLARHSGRVVSHRALLAAVWGANSTEQPEYLRVFISHLRNKLEAHGAGECIHTEPWVGYRFEACE